MPENECEQKYPFLLVFLQVCGLRGTPKYISLADVRSAIYSVINQQVTVSTRLPLVSLFLSYTVYYVLLLMLRNKTSGETLV